MRSWSEQKYKLIGCYADIFTRGMRYKWDKLIYIDLFAGAGYSLIKGSRKILKSSTLIAMDIPIKFDKYILCEENPEKLSALKIRVQREHPDLDVVFIEGDSNRLVEKIKSEIPLHSKTTKVLPFSFVDPYSLNLHFATIRHLGQNLMDFLILLALHMDANRNFDIYLNENSTKIDHFIGDSNWRLDFQNRFSSNHSKFVNFLATKYEENMINIGYKKPPEFHQIRSDDKNLPLYYLAFYSKHERGNDFWAKTKKFSNPQTSLDF
ncbi:three-Cys-motif partner protein TcmP [Chitinophaga sp. LS1]|uniref:three-Cys-motif partner protein TcmP n=1 Tax=Chitinophaga sp. LS1 TaxID=3051176 RepID=UPI002AAC15BE|nr:three-Cys-motif partner protein TcmP [Chitinophaga sp. LS1]WPV70562.1 three-Cys-motif partner protein TcmP [Chitinophaga sp. LS1]